MVNGTQTPKQLAARMGVSPKRLRAMLRAERPRAIEMKGKKWELGDAEAKKIREEYKAKKVKAEAEKKAQVKKELAGEGEAEVTKELEGEV